jgi:hypothetical protein
MMQNNQHRNQLLERRLPLCVRWNCAGPMATGSAEDDPLAKSADVRRPGRLPSPADFACVYDEHESWRWPKKLVVSYCRDRRGEDWLFGLVDSWGKYARY